MTQLWTDKHIEDLFERIDKAAATLMRNDYEHELATRNEDIGNLRNDLTRAQARIAELEAQAAQQWMQLIANEEHIQDDKTVLIENQGQWVGIRRGDVVFGVWLDQLGCAAQGAGGTSCAKRAERGDGVNITGTIYIYALIDTHGNTWIGAVNDPSDTIQVYGISGAANGRFLHFESEAHHIAAWAKDNGLRYNSTTQTIAMEVK